MAGPSGVTGNAGPPQLVINDSGPVGQGTGYSLGLGGAAALNVYMGARQTGGDTGQAGVFRKPTFGPDLTPASQAALLPYTWSQQQQADMQKKMFAAGLINDPSSFDAMLNAWQIAVGHAANYYLSGKKVTPFDVIDMASASAKKAGPRTTTSTSRDTSLPSETDAQSAVRKIFQDQMGRDPTSGELSHYVGIAMSKSRANPSTTTRTTTTDLNGNSTSSSTTSGGVNLGEVLSQQAANDPEHGAFQAATTYMAALERALGAPVSG